jgi:hypothetical protein
MPSLDVGIEERIDDRSDISLGPRAKRDSFVPGQGRLLQRGDPGVMRDLRGIAGRGKRALSRVPPAELSLRDRQCRKRQDPEGF